MPRAVDGWVTDVEQWLDEKEIQLRGKMVLAPNAAMRAKMESNLSALNGLRYAVLSFGSDGSFKTMKKLWFEAYRVEQIYRDSQRWLFDEFFDLFPNPELLPERKFHFQKKFKKNPFCSGKRCFRTEVDAKAVLARIALRRYRSSGKVECRCYLCHKCHAWHLTSKSDRNDRGFYYVKPPQR